MSADNFLLIKKQKGKYVVEHHNFGWGKCRDKFPKSDTIEEAIRIANCFKEENEVEYGLEIKI